MPPICAAEAIDREILSDGVWLAIVGGRFVHDCCEELQSN